MLDKKEPFYQLSECKDFLDLKEVWLGSVDSAIGSAKVLAVSARHSSGSRLVISMAVPVKRRTLWLVERRWVTPAPSSCWKVVKRLLQEIKHTNKHLKKNVDVLRSFGRTFSTFLVSQFIPCFSWFHRFFLGILSFPTYPSVFQVMVEFPCLSLVLILDFLNCHRDFQFHGMKYQIFLPPPKKGMAVHQTWGKDGGGREEEVKQSESSRSPPVLWLMLLRNPKIPLYSVFATDKAFLDNFEMS